MNPIQTQMTLKQAVKINLNHFKRVARLVCYWLLLMVILTALETVFILSAAADMRWLNWVWTLLILLGITLAIIKRRNLRKYLFSKAVRIAVPILLRVWLSERSLRLAYKLYSFSGQLESGQLVEIGDFIEKIITIREKKIEALKKEIETLEARSRRLVTEVSLMRSFRSIQERS
ncbi:hypothetical protein HYR99_10945 [Candidatus Poribacteria bacterium]|nr:hypothetical protein [Candidatus Poribacteria bacterium]